MKYRSSNKKAEIPEGVLDEVDLVALAEHVHFDKQKVADTMNGVFDPVMSGNCYT